MQPQLLNYIQNLFEHQKKLINKIPNLKHYFIDIFVPEWNINVPFLPIRCFRDFNLHLQWEEQIKFFLSSGSTGNKQSRHFFTTNALKSYEKNTCEGFLNFLKSHNLNQKTPIISLIPLPSQWPTSSLAAMIDMFAQNNFPVSWFDIEYQKENILSYLKEIPSQSDCLIFGTTFHHLFLANESNFSCKKGLQEQFQRLNISIIDTGGTKGRTQAFTLEETKQVLSDFYNSPNFSFFSEYGMCELSSQAWSTKKIHDGTFSCNKTLHPFAITIEKNMVLPHHENGFIAFIDEVNAESWGAIITEDIGCTYNEKDFYLLGRGPDASIKGCSLNVRNIFSFAKQTSKQIVKDVELLSPNINLLEICQILEKDKLWDNSSLQDFKIMASSIEQKIKVQAQFHSKNILIISAANTPIAWLFPFLIFATSEAKSITIKIPSLRLDDYYAQNVISKTNDLIEIMSKYFPMTQVYIDSSKTIANTFDDYDIVLTFGTNETLETISGQINKTKTKFIGKGDIKNSIKINPSDTPDDIVSLCSYWNGRGCLTPVSLFYGGPSSERLNWCHDFASKLELEYLRRVSFSKINLVQEFVHSHNCAFVRGQIKQLGLDDSMILSKGSLTCVVNLSQYSMKELEGFEPDFSFGGCGFVYIFPHELIHHFQGLQQVPVLPSVGDFIFNEEQI